MDDSQKPAQDFLSDAERTALTARHKQERDKRVADRIKAVLLRDKGWSHARVAEALFLSDEGVRNHLADYWKDSARLQPRGGGSKPDLDEKQTQELNAHLDEKIYRCARDVAHYVKEKYGVTYSERGMEKWLIRNGLTYHKPVGIPAKANKALQEEWIKKYEEAKKALQDNEKMLFMDGVHPTHAVRLTEGWIRKGVRKEIPTNGSQKRLNILGALNLEDMSVHVQEHKTIDAKAIIAFFTYLLTLYPGIFLTIILDNARYHTCPEVMQWLATQPRLKLFFLPTYSPNLNTIERLWKIMHEHTTQNEYLPHFKNFTEKIWGFFNDTFPEKSSQWIDRLTDNFRAIGSPLTANS
jgi:transposase